jgi:hypothetical protein
MRKAEFRLILPNQKVYKQIKLLCVVDEKNMFCSCEYHIKCPSPLFFFKYQKC